jgi:hypothetical protein
MICLGGFVLSTQARKEELTLLVVPREEVPVRLGVDIASHYPVLLVSYKVLNGQLSLHGWTGKQWVNITPRDYTEGNFFKKGPNSALIVEKEGTPIPDALIPSVDWCSDVAKVTTTQLRPLIHLSGQYFDFKYKEWNWFSKRYSLELGAINPEGLNMAWYHKRLDEHIKSGKPVGSDDLQYWVSLRQTVAAVAPVEEKGMGDDGEAIADPFTNAVPPAVIMGASNVPEETAEDDSTGKETAEEAEEADPENKPPVVEG